MSVSLWISWPTTTHFPLFLNPFSTSRGMGFESRRWGSLSLKQRGLEKMVVSELFLPWTRKIPSELPFSPCDNSRNQAATALGERLSFSWLLRWQRPWESWYFWPTLPTSYHPAQDSPSWTLVPPSLFLILISTWLFIFKPHKPSSALRSS